ncbi:cardiolipin synthase [Alkalihalobacterium chitinilyticum]|uniref:Cardiolipin synthase n=1 Tax=Alkalihalobacterium chitinilyticum TaxID=2980103 RepID=A0ABT5VHA6_9BACI|nr:cardiolipin synthase [Alkalihalobacterium chitinilyticum]MDE5414660.1 cardiolipin synthase [Alkalihalobacterium chitinilyticum]
MALFLIILSIIILIAILLRLDFKFGLKKQRKEAKRFHQEMRYSNVNLLTTGDDLFDHLFQDIKQASNHIHILFYIIKDDNISKKMMSLLIDKAKEGVKVRLLVDRIGGGIKGSSLKKLKEAGVSFSYSHPVKFPYLFFTLNRRNHRKITVIDGKIGYVGGYNVGDEYLGRDPKFGNWRDFHLRLDGDGVQDLQEQFYEDWHAATKEKISRDYLYPPLIKGDVALRILPTDGVYLEDTFAGLIRQAENTVTIGTPYFIPGMALQGELINAAKRGVNVRLIVPKKADHPLVKEASYPYFKDLLDVGVDIYQYYRGFYHAKILIIDDEICDIGTANFDKRSFHIDHEINCLIYDSSFIQSVVDEVEYDISISERLTLKQYNQRSIFQKGKERFATMFSGLL